MKPRFNSSLFALAMLPVLAPVVFGQPVPNPKDGMTAPNPAVVIPTAGKTRPLNVAIYQDKGSGDSGIQNCIDRAALLPGTKVTPLTGEDFATQDLSVYDVVVFSGGSGSKQAEGLGEVGRQKVRQYVHDGGNYLGICAGAYLATSGYTWSLGILNAKTVSPKWRRGNAFLEMELTDDGKKVFGDVKDKFFVRYNNGPVIKPAGSPDLPPYTVSAYFRTEIANNETPVGVQVNSPAVVQGIYGKGKVVSISPHPEGTRGLENFVPRALVWLGEK